MEFIQTKINIVLAKLEKKGLYDPRVLLLFLVSFIALSVFWSGAKIVQQNYELTLKAQQIENENQILELENRNKELQNQYLATDEFAELTARRVFGRAAPGEKVYIVPKEVALAALTTSNEEVLEDDTPIQKPQYQKNLDAWLNIYFGN